ncbi:MAG: AMP-binding protein, partial [Treponema sp.]|nr:AMP-binding protein [Treponema sp.]
MVFDSNYTIPKMIRDSAEKWPEVPAQYHKLVKGGEFQPVLYREMYQFALDVAAGLINIGVNRGDLIGLIADNRAEWLYTSLAINGLGAVDVPRGCDATPNDLVQILGLTEIKTVVTENGAQVNKIVSLKDQLPCLERIIVFESEVKEEFLELAKKNKVEVLFYKNVLANGQKWRIENPGKVEEEFDKGTGEDVCTIIFTSGTTGTPKGVQLTHKGYLAQLDEIPERIYLNPGDKALSVLPVWHVFEREVEYVILIQGGTLCYSKPVGSILLADFKAINPHLLPAVPRVFEAVYDGVTKKMRKAGGIVLKLFNFFVGVAKLQKRMSRLMFNQNPCFTRYTPVLWWILFIIPWTLLWPLYWLGDLIIFRKIKAMLGTNFRAGIAGGGAYPKTIDEFFWAIGVEIVEGYGLSETSPIVSV